MEDHVIVSSSALVLSFLLFAFAILKKYQKSKTTREFPHGPWRLPKIGNVHQVVSPLPHRRPRDLAKKYGPVMHLQLGQVPHLIISSPGTALDVMKTHDIMFAETHSSLAAAIITYNRSSVRFGPYGAYWRQLRRICTIELLIAKRVESFRSIREEEVSSLVRSIVAPSCEGSHVNLSRMLLSLTSNIVSRTVLGMSSKQTDEFMLLNRISEIPGGLNIGDFW